MRAYGYISKGDKNLFNTRATIFLPLLIVTQLNVGYYMIFQGPYISRIFPVAASVTIMRNLIAIILLLLVLMSTRDINI